MTFLYLMSFKEKAKETPRCASVVHVVITWGPGKYVLSCNTQTAPGDAALNSLTKTIQILPFKQDRIKVITDNHELAWDLQNILAGRQGEFLPKHLWQKFIAALSENDMSMGQFSVSESSMMMSCERDLAREQIAQTNWGFAL